MISTVHMSLDRWIIFFRLAILKESFHLPMSTCWECLRCFSCINLLKNQSNINQDRHKHCHCSLQCLRQITRRSFACSRQYFTNTCAEFMRCLRLCVEDVSVELYRRRSVLHVLSILLLVLAGIFPKAWIVLKILLFSGTRLLLINKVDFCCLFEAESTSLFLSLRKNFNVMAHRSGLWLANLRSIRLEVVMSLWCTIAQRISASLQILK